MIHPQHRNPSLFLPVFNDDVVNREVRICTVHSGCQQTIKNKFWLVLSEDEV